MRCSIALLAVVAVALTTMPVRGQRSDAGERKVLRDLQYTKEGLALDLYLPSERLEPVPCIVFVHGGGWKGGDKKSAARTAAWLTDHGFAIASINYRLTDQAQWPAQINDCYSAVRWVRRHAEEYGIDATHVGAWGTSAGAHLAALMGTRPFPGTESVSSRVQAVCDWYGPAELLSMPPNNIGKGRTEDDIAKSNGAKLLGATVRDVPDLARDASALDQVSADDAAFLIMHGDQDPGVPLDQSQRLHAKLIKAGVSSQLRVISGGGHGGPEFQTVENRGVVLRFFQRRLMQNWNQGPGPEANFRVTDASPPTDFSVVRSKHVRWRKELPETGQSTVVSWGDRLFFSTIKPVDGDGTLSSDIVAWCCDAGTGRTIWTQEVAAPHPLRISGCFGDSSAPPPVTDGRHVCFLNASGRIACFDFSGKEIWNRDMMAVARTQPTLVGQNVVFIRQSYMPNEQGKFTHDNKDLPRDRWTQLQALDLASGGEVWKTSCGVNMGCVPLLQNLSDGRQVMIVGRGGGHSPPEKPDGISMVDASDGSTVWTLPLAKFMSTMTFHVYGDDALVFDGRDHHWVDVYLGKIRHSSSICDNVQVRMRIDGRWLTQTRSIEKHGKSRDIIQQSNVLAGAYHYFRSYTRPWLGRVDLQSRRVEYLQLPVQLNAKMDVDDDKLVWTWRDMDARRVKELLSRQRKPSKELPITQWAMAPNDMKNSRGYVVVGDDRSRGNGWGHHASQVPTVIGPHLYVPTMSGTVYVIRWNADSLDESAIVAINDLGPVGQSWNRASLSYRRGQLLAHTIGELICIED